jgi:hypothetical protein
VSEPGRAGQRTRRAGLARIGLDGSTPRWSGKCGRTRRLTYQWAGRARGGGAHQARTGQQWTAARLVRTAQSGECGRPRWAQVAQLPVGPAGTGKTGPA